MRRALLLGGLWLLLPRPAVAGTSRSYLAFFDWSSTEVNARGEAAVQALADVTLEYRTSFIDIKGHADRSEPDGMALSLRRAEQVADLLMQRGVPGVLLRSIGHGTDRPVGPTAAGVPELLNRRVHMLPP